MNELNNHSPEFNILHKILLVALVAIIVAEFVVKLIHPIVLIMLLLTYAILGCERVSIFTYKVYKLVKVGADLDTSFAGIRRFYGHFVFMPRQGLCQYYLQHINPWQAINRSCDNRCINPDRWVCDFALLAGL